MGVGPVSESRRHLLQEFAAVVGMTAASCGWVHALTNSGVVVLVPDVAEPFRGIFLRIVEGIESGLSSRADLLFVNAQLPAEIAAEVQRRRARLVVAMGRQGLKSVSALELGLPVIGSCVVSVPESGGGRYPVYTLAPDPTALFAQLRRLVPTARRISVVIDPRQNAWLLRRAIEAAPSLGLEVVAHQTDDAAAVLKLYAQIMRGAEAERDALWLPQDSTTVIDEAVLPFVLKESWNRGVAVFSSQLSHVKRGVLFALYPDEAKLGRTIGEAAAKMLASGKGADGAMPLRDLRVAINSRTASHLGLSVQVAAYDLVYPVP